MPIRPILLDIKRAMTATIAKQNVDIQAPRIRGPCVSERSTFGIGSNPNWPLGGSLIEESILQGRGTGPIKATIDIY